MTKDFAKDKPSSRKKNNNKKNKRKSAASNNSSARSQVPVWVWLFTGATAGALVMFLIYLSSLSPNEPQSAVHNEVAKHTEKSTQQPKPRFDFYQLLKESEVPVNTPEPTSNNDNTALPSNPETLEYILQVGSFKSSVDADRMRAQLILLNLDVHTETATIRTGEVWHRVLVGPFQSRSMMSKARGVLVSNDISPLVLKRKSQI